MPSRLTFNATVALKHEGMMSFGTASWIQDDTLGFVADAILGVGDHAQLRLELQGIPDTVLAEIIVVKARQDPRREAFRYAARIDHMAPGDRELLEAWVEERSVGSTSFTSERMLISLTGSAPSKTGRRKRPPGKSQEKKGSQPGDARSGQTWDPSSSVSHHRERGRARINAALRTSLDQGSPDGQRMNRGTSPRESEREDSSGASETPSATSTWSQSSVYSTTSKPAPETTYEPRVKWTEKDARATVTWSDAAVLARDWTTHLCNKALPLPLDKPHPPRGARIILKLVLPDGQALSGRARVRGRAGRTVLMAVDLPPGVRHKLRRVAKAFKKSQGPQGNKP